MHRDEWRKRLEVREIRVIKATRKGGWQGSKKPRVMLMKYLLRRNTH